MDIARDLSIQLYSLRAYRDLEAQLKALAELGFRTVETIGGHLADAAGTRALLDRFGIEAPTSHIGMADLRERPDWVIGEAQTLGILQLFMPAVPPDERVGQPAAYWRGLGRELATLADRFAEAGLALGYHNHDWELRAYPDGSTPLDHLLEASEGSALTIEADLAWIAKGGGYRRFTSRTWRRRGGTPTRMAGLMSAPACWTGRRSGGLAWSGVRAGWCSSTTSPATRSASRGRAAPSFFRTSADRGQG
jgi:hypothetical protein